jgi:hypothetical protein
MQLNRTTNVSAESLIAHINPQCKLAERGKLKYLIQKRNLKTNGHDPEGLAT